MAKEDGGDILKKIGELTSAGMMLKGGIRPRKPEEGSKLNKSGGGAPERSGRLAMKEAAGGKAKYADIQAQEGTVEWHDQVFEGLKNGQLAPAIKVTPETAAQAKAVVAVEANRAKIGFLLKPGEPLPDSDVVLQIYADIAQSSFANDPKYLLAKEAQLLSTIKPDAVAAEQMKIINATKGLDQRIFELSHDTHPEYVRMTVRLHSDALDKQMGKDEGKKDNREQEEALEVEEQVSKNTQGKTSEIAEAKSTIREQLVLAAGEDSILAAGAAELRIPDDAAAFIGEKIQGGATLRAAIKQYFEEVRPLLESGSMDNANLGRMLFLDKAGDILHDPELKMREIQGASVASPLKVFDSGWTFSATNPDVKAYLEELQNKLDNLPYYINHPRKIEEALEKVASFNSADLPVDATGNPVDVVGELQTRYGQLMEQSRGRGEGITDQFSDLYMAARKRGLMALYPQWMVNELYRGFNEMITYNTRGQIAEQFMRDISQVASYYANDQFAVDIRQLLTDTSHPEYQAAIVEATGVPINPKDIEHHPFYTDRINACNAAKKEVADLMNAKENLTYAYGVIKSGEEFKIHKSVLGELGDRGVFTIKTGNDYLTGVAYDMFDTIAGELGYDWVEGGMRRIGDKEMALLFNDVVEVMTQNSDLLQRRFKQYWEGRSSLVSGKDYSKLEKALHIESHEIAMDFGENNERLIGMVKEAQKLYTASLREVYAREKSLAPGESNGQRGQAPKYGAEEGIYQYLKGRRPVGFFIERWDMPTAAGRLHLHVMADQYARLVGIDKSIEPMLDHAMGNLGYKKELVERALGVVEAAGEKSALGTFFEFDLNGKKIEHPPASIESLTRDQLKDLMLYKEGVKYADLVLGSYDYEGATWVSAAKTTVIDLIYGKDAWTQGIGMGEMKRKWGSQLIGSESHEGVKEAQDMLIYGKKLHHGEVGDSEKDQGILRVYADYMPQRNFQDLTEHNHWESLLEHQNMVKDGIYKGVFTERHIAPGGGDEWRAVEIAPDKPEIAFRHIKRVWRMTDEFISYGKNINPTPEDPTKYLDIDSSPINYAKGPTPEQDAWLSRVCENMHVDKEGYLKIMKRMSEFGGRKPQLEELVKPQYLDIYTSVQDLDSREKFLDTPDKAPGTKYQKGTLAIESNVTVKASGLMGGQEGRSKMSGIARVSGDCGNASDNTMNFMKMIGTLSQKQLMTTLPDFANGILFVYGNTWKHRGVGIVAGSWAKCARMDPALDWSLVGTLGTLIESSPFRRVTHLTGDHGAPTMTLNEEHKFWETMQIEAGVVMRDAEMLNHFEEKELGLLWKIGETYTPAPWYLYTYSLAGGLAAVGLTAALVNEASEGFSGGGGGGGGAHHS